MATVRVFDGQIFVCERIAADIRWHLTELIMGFLCLMIDRMNILDLSRIIEVTNDVVHKSN